MTIEIASDASLAELSGSLRDFAQKNDIPEPSDLEIDDQFSERSIDGGSVLTVYELSTGFLVGVGSGLMANWLSHVISSGLASSVRFGRNRIEPDDLKDGQSEVLERIINELEELKRPR